MRTSSSWSNVVDPAAAADHLIVFTIAIQNPVAATDRAHARERADDTTIEFVRADRARRTRFASVDPMDAACFDEADRCVEAE